MLIGAQWCAKHYLQVKALRKVAEVKAQLVDIVKQQKIELSFVGLGDWDVVGSGSVQSMVAGLL